MTEDQLEQETLSWLTDVGYTHAYGPDIAPDRTIGVRLNAVHLSKNTVSFRVNTLFKGAAPCQAKQQPCSRAFALLIT